MMNESEKAQRHQPLNILKETYRPLAFFAGEMLLAAAPFLPEISQSWARQLIRLDAASANEKSQEQSVSGD